jgi:hypothetical protein
LLDFLPGGNHLKGRLMLRLKPTIGLLGQPNMKAGRALLPEILDVVNAPMLAEALTEVLETEGLLAGVQQELNGLYSWAPTPSESMIETMLASTTRP